PIAKGGSLDGLKAFYDKYIFGVENFEQYLDLFPVSKLLAAKAAEAVHCERLA
ncbi:MAG: CoA transferase subunit A, partial [Desulfobulbaceae bacterium]|nr:CoA transferase subunit A [Desulfobulbaceae bacterium]